MLVFGALIYAVLIFKAYAFEPYLDTQQCHALHISQFEYLLKNFVSEVPTTLVIDRNAFEAYITEKFIHNEYLEENIYISPAVPFSPGGYVNETSYSYQLQNLITQYFLSPSTQLLERIGIISILSPGYVLPQTISTLIVKNNILSTASALESFISVYLETSETVLLTYIAQLTAQYPNVAIQSEVLNILVSQGYISIATEATLLQLIQQAIVTQEITIYQQIAQLSVVFTNVQLPAAIVRALIENNLFTYQQGEIYYRRILAEASVAYSLTLLQEIVEFSYIYPNIAIPEIVLRGLIQYNLLSSTSFSTSTAVGSVFATEATLIQLIQQALTASTYTLLQQIAHLSSLFTRVPIPAVIMRQLVVNSLVHASRGEAMLVSLIAKAQVTITIEVLQEIALLYDLFPNVIIPENILQALIANKLITGISVTWSETYFSELIEQTLTTVTISNLQEIIQLILLYPGVAIPSAILQQIQLYNMIRSYLTTPTLIIIQESAQLLQTYPNFPIPASLISEITTLGASSSSLSVAESRLQALIWQYLEVPNESLLEEIGQLVELYPNFPIPTSIVLVLTQRFSSYEVRTTVETFAVSKLLEQYALNIAEVTIYQLAEFYARSTYLVIPSSISTVMSTIIITTTTTTTTEISSINLIELINRWFATQSVSTLNEIIVVAKQFPTFPIPEYVVYHYLIQQYLSTRSIEYLNQISVLMFKYQEVYLQETIIEAFITTNIWTSRAINTQMLLQYLIKYYSSTQSYTILKFIASLFWLHPETVLPYSIIEQLIRYGLLRIASQEALSVQEIQAQLILLQQLIKQYSVTSSVTVLEQIIKIVQVITSYPLPEYIWIQYYILMYERTSSKFYLEQIGRRLYRSWQTVISENIMSLLLQERLLFGTLESEVSLLNYLITNYQNTKSVYILAAVYQLYQRFSDVTIPEVMYNFYISVGLITNVSTRTAVSNIENIISELNSVSVQEVSQQASLLGILPWRQATLEKVIIVTESRINDVQALVADYNSQIVDTVLPTQQTIATLLNSILSSLTYFLREAQIRASTNKEILLNVHTQTSEIVQTTVANYAENVEIAFGALGRARGATEALVAAYESGSFSIKSLGIIIRTYLMIENSFDSIESIFDDLTPLVTLNEETRAAVLETVMPYRLATVEKYLIVNQQRLQELIVLVEATISPISANGNEYEQRISVLLRSIIALIRSFINEAEVRITSNRKIFFRQATNNFVIESSELNIFTENLRIALANLGRAAGAIESVVLGISTKTITVSSITIILKQIMQVDQTVSTVESIFDQYLTMPSVSTTATQATLASILPWRLAVVEKHVSVVQYRLKDLTTLVESIQSTQTNFYVALSAVLNYVSSIVTEASARITANKNILEWFVSNNFVASSEQLALFNENEKIIQLNLGRASGATEAIVVTFLSGEFTITQLKTIIQSVMTYEESTESLTVLYNDLNLLSSISVSSNLQTTLVSILRNLVGDSSTVSLSNSISDAAALQSIISAFSISLQSGKVLTGKVQSLDDVIALQTILAVMLPARQALLDKHVIIALQRLDELKVLTADILNSAENAGPTYSSLIMAVDQLTRLVTDWTMTAQAKSNENRNFITAAAKKNFLISGQELQPFINNVKESINLLGRASGTVIAISQAYNNGQFTINTIAIVMQFLLQLEQSNFKIEQTFQELETLTVSEETRVSVLSVLLPWRQAFWERQIQIYKSRLTQSTVLITEIVQSTPQQTLRNLIVSISTMITTMINEASARILANQNIIQWLTTSNSNSLEILVTYNENGQIIEKSLGTAEGAIEAIVNAYTNKQFSVTTLNIILQAILSIDTSITTIETTYEELTTLATLSIGSNLQATVSNVLQSVLGSSQQVTSTGTITSAIALQSILETISNIQTSTVTSVTDVIALQTVLSVTMTSLQTMIEKHIIVAQSRLEEFIVLTDDVSARALEAGGSYKIIASLVSQLVSSVKILIEEAATKVVTTRSIVSVSASQSFIITGEEILTFTENVRIVLNNLGKAAGTIEAFSNAYNGGKFSMSSIRVILQTMVQYDESSTTIGSLYDQLQLVYQMDNVARQTSLSAILPWRQAIGARNVHIYQNRLAELTVLTNSIEETEQNYAMLAVVRSIVTYITSTITEVASRQLANENILKIASSQQYVVPQQDLVPFEQNQNAMFSSLGRVEGAIQALTQAYATGQFTSLDINVIIQALIAADKSTTHIEILYDNLIKLLSESTNLRGNLKSIVKNYLENYLGMNYVEYSGTADDVSALRSLLNSLSINLGSNSLVSSGSSVSETVALQTILAIILPARLALLDKFVLLLKVRLEETKRLVDDYIAQSEEAGPGRVVMVTALSQIISSISYFSAETEVRANENRQIVQSAAKKSFFISSTELDLFAQNLNVAAKNLGYGQGAIEALAVSYNSGQLTVVKIQTILRYLMLIDPAIATIEAIYDELIVLTVSDIKVRQLVLSKILPWRMATIERHITINTDRIKELKTLVQSVIVTTQSPTYNVVFNALYNVIDSLVNEAESRSQVVRNYFKAIREEDYNAPDEQLIAMTKNVKEIGDTLGKANGAIEYIVISYTQGKFSTHTIEYIINQFLDVDRTSLSIQTIYDELSELASITVGSNLHSTFLSVLSQLDSRIKSTEFGVVADAQSLRAVLEGFNTDLTAKYENVGVTSVADVIALQTIFAVLLPSRQATLEKFILVHQQRFEEFKILTENTIAHISNSGLPSAQSIVSLLRGIVSVVNYFTSDAQIRATASRNVLNAAISRRFLITSQELQSFTDNLVTAFTALGRAAGATDALITAIDSGNLNVASLRIIIQTTFMTEESTTSIEGIFDDLQPLMNAQGLDYRNILEITMPAILAKMERGTSLFQNRFVEFTNLVEDTVRQSLETSQRSYESMGTLLKSTLNLVNGYLVENIAMTQANSKIVALAASNNFQVSTADLQEFADNDFKYEKSIGRGEGAIVAVVNAFNAGQLSVSTLTVIIKTLLQADSSITKIEDIYQTIQSLFSSTTIETTTVQVAVSILLPWQMAYTQKMITINEKRVQSLKILVNSIIQDYASNQVVVSTVNDILVLVTSYTTEINSRYLANQNLFTWVHERNFNVVLNDLVSFNENEAIIWKLFGRISGAIESLATTYTAGKLSVHSVDVILQEMLVVDTSELTIESLYDQLSFLESLSLSVGSNLQTTLTTLIGNYLGGSTTVQYTGGQNEAVALRSLLSTLSTSLATKSATSVTSVNDVVALQVILAVVLPARQATLDKLVINARGRLQKLQLLINSYSQQSTSLGDSNSSVAAMLNVVLTSVTYWISEAEVRASENRVFVTNSAQKRFLISAAELGPYVSNIQVAESSLGRASGAIEAIVNAYNSGQLSIIQITTILTTMLQIDQSIPSIEAVYDEIGKVVVQDIAIRPTILSKLLPWRLATIEGHLNINAARVSQFKLLVDDIIVKSSNKDIVFLVSSTWSLVSALVEEAQSRFVAVKNSIEYIKSKRFEVSDTQVNAMLQNIQVIDSSLGRASAAIDQIVIAYKSGYFSVNTIKFIINSIIDVQSSTSAIELLYDELQMLSSMTVGSNLQTTLTSLLSNLGSVNSKVVFGSASDAVALQSILASINTALSTTYSNVLVSSITDVVALQSVFAVLLPSRQATVEKFLIVHKSRLVELRVLVEDIVVQMEASDLPSHKSVISLLRSIVSIITYYVSEAEIRVTANRESLNLAINRNFLLTTQEFQPFVDNLMTAFAALGRSAGATDALINAINSGDLSVNILKVIVQTIFQVEESSVLIEQIFDNLQPLLTIEGLDVKNILEIVLPAHQEALEVTILKRQERIVEFTILVNDLIARSTETNSQSYLSVSSLMQGILSVVQSQISKAVVLSSQSAKILTVAASNNFAISTSELKTFSETIASAFLLIGRSEGAITAVVSAYNAGELSVKTLTLVIQTLLQFEESITSIENIYTRLDSFYELNVSVRQSVLAVLLPWRFAKIEKLVVANEARISELTILIQDITVKSESNSIRVVVQSVLTLVTSLVREASSRLVANRNLLKIMTEQDFNVATESLVAISQNENFIMQSLGKVAGATEALVVSYMSGRFSVKSVSFIIQAILQIDQSSLSIENLYDNLQLLSSLSVGSNLQVTLQNILNNYAGGQISYSGSLNEAAALRALLQSISTSLSVTSISSLNDVVALQTIFAVILPSRQALLEKLYFVFQQRIAEFNTLTSDIIIKLTSAGITEQAAVVLINRVVASVNYLFSEVQVRVVENRQFISSSVNRKFLISSSETYAYFANIEFATKYFGQISGIIDSISSAYSSGQFSVVLVTSIINTFVKLEQNIPAIETIYDELASLKSLSAATRQSILSSLLPWRLATLEKHIVINQKYLQEITVLIESILKLPTQNILKQLVQTILSYETSLANEANARLFANKQMMSTLAAHNYVVTDQQLQAFASNINTANLLLGKAKGTTEAIVASYLRGDFSYQAVNIVINSVITLENDVSNIESIYEGVGSLLSAQSGLHELLASILKSINSAADISLGSSEDATSLQTASLTIAPIQPLSTTAVISINEVVALQIVLAVSMTQRQSVIDARLVSTSKRVEDVRVIVESVIPKYTSPGSASNRELVTQLGEIYSLIVFLFNESQTRAATSRSIVEIATSRNFLITTIELQKFINNLRASTVALGKATGAIDAITVAYAKGEITSFTLTGILIKLRNSLAILQFAEEFANVPTVIHETQELVTTYSETHSYSALKKIAEIVSSNTNIVISEQIRQELTQYGLLPGITITEEIILKQLIQEYIETQSSEILLQIVPLLKLYPATPIPYEIIVALIRMGILIESEAYYLLVIKVYAEYPNEAILLISHFITVYPYVPLTLQILEQLVHEQYITVEVLEQLVRIWLETKSPLALRLILEIYQRFPTYPLPLEILDMIYEINSKSTSTSVSTSSITEITSEMTRSLSNEDLLALLIKQFQEFPTEALLLEINELYLITPQATIPVIVFEQITLYRLIQETLLLPAPSLSVLQKIATMSQLYPIVTIPESIQEQISLVLWTQNLKPSFEILRKISLIYRFYPYIPIPLPIQEQLLLLDLIQNSYQTITTIEKIASLSKTYDHLVLSTSITEQITLVSLIKSPSPTVEIITQIIALSSSYSYIKLPAILLEQVKLVNLINQQTISQTNLLEIIRLTRIYPNIVLPNRINDLITLQSLVEEIVITKYASETTVQQISVYIKTYTYYTLPSEVQDISLLYQLIDTALKTTYVSLDIIKQIFTLSQAYPKIPVPTIILQQISERVQISTTSTVTSSSTTTSQTQVTVPASVTAEEYLQQLISQALQSPSLSIIQQIISLLSQAPSVTIPTIIQQQIKLVELITTASSSTFISQTQLEDISTLSSSFPYITIPNQILQQITLVQLISELTSSSFPSIVLIRQVAQLSLTYPNIALPVRMQEIILLVQLIDQVVTQSAPSPYLVDDIASRALSYPFVPIPIRIQEQIALQRLIIKVSQTSSPSFELLNELAQLSRAYPHVGLPSAIQDQITLYLLIQEATTTTPTVELLLQISSLSTMYVNIKVPLDIVQQISFVNMINTAIQSRSPSFAIVQQIISLSKTYPHIPVPTFIIQLNSYYQLLEEVTVSTTPSTNTLIQIAQLSQIFPFIPIAEGTLQQVMLLQLINEFSISPSVVLLEEITRISSLSSNVILSESLQQQISFLRLLKEVSMSPSPSVSVLKQIATLSQTYTYVTIPSHIQQQITLIQLLSVSIQSSSFYSSLPQIVELSTNFPYIPISENIQQIIVLYNLIQQVLLTPSPVTATLIQISELYKLYPNYPVPASILQLLQQLSSSTASVTTSVTTSTTSVTTSQSGTTTTATGTSVSEAQNILRQLISQSIKAPPTVVILQQIASLSLIATDTVIPTAIQQQILLLKLIEQALSSVSPSPHLLHQIDVLSGRFPHITVPISIQQQITLINLIESISGNVSPAMETVQQIAILYKLYPYVPLPAAIQQQIVFIQLIEEVTSAKTPSVTIIRQIAQLSAAFPNIIVPQPIKEQITLLQLISQVSVSTIVSTSVVQQIAILSKSYPYITLPSTISEIISLVSLIQKTSLTLAEVEQLEILSTSYTNVVIPYEIQQQIRLVQLIRMADASTSASYSIILEIAQLSSQYSNIALTSSIKEQVLLINLIQQVTNSLICELSVTQQILKLSSIYTNIPITEFIKNCIAVQSLTSSSTLTYETIQEIEKISTSFPSITISNNAIKEQILLVQLIQEFTASSSPSVALIQQIINLSQVYTNVPLPIALQEVILLLQLIQQVLTEVNVSSSIIQQIITLSAKYPYIPIPSLIRQRIELENLIQQVTTSAVPLPTVLQQITEISQSFPTLVLPSSVAEQQQLLQKQSVLLDLISQVETSGVVDTNIISQIEQLSQYFPGVPLPQVVQDYIFQHFQETIMQQLVNEALETPNTPLILQQIEQMTFSLPNYVLPESVLQQIVTMQQTALLEQLINELLASSVFSEVSLHQILQVSKTVPSYALPTVVQQALTLQSLVESVQHTPSSSNIDVSALKQISVLSQSVPKYVIPQTVLKLIQLMTLIEQAQQSTTSVSEESILQIFELSQAYPNYVVPSSVLQRITEVKNTIQLRNLINQAQTSSSVDISVLQQIAQLSSILSNVPLPPTIQQQVTLVKLIQKAQSGTLESSLIKQLAELSRQYPNIPLPASVRQLISPAQEIKKTTATAKTGSEAQLRQFVTMYERVASPLILRQIAQLLPTVPGFQVSEKVMLALVQQGLISADTFPQMQLQQLIQQYQSAPSQSLIEQIAQLSSTVPGVILPASVQQAVALQQALSTYNDLVAPSASAAVSAAQFENQIVSLRQESLDRQVQLSEGYLEQARGVMRQLMENVRASGHPMHRATFSAFESVLDLISHLTHEANVAVAASKAQADASSVATTSQSVEVLLGRAEGARQALLKEAKEFSSSVIANSDRVITQAQKTKDQMEIVFNDLITQTSGFTNRSTRSTQTRSKIQ